VAVFHGTLAFHGVVRHEVCQQETSAGAMLSIDGEIFVSVFRTVVPSASANHQVNCALSGMAPPEVMAVRLAFRRGPRRFTASYWQVCALPGRGGGDAF